MPCAAWLLRRLLPCLAASAALRGALAEYDLVIDAGSTGSRIRIFRMSEGRLEQVTLPSKEEAAQLETEPGIASYASSLELAGPSLQGIVDAAAGVVPKAEQPRSRLWLMATGGARLMESSRIRRLLGAVAGYLSNSSHSPFVFQSTQVMSGQKEAVYAFLAMNDLLGTLKGETVGVLDMGGASTQIAFEPQDMVLSNEFDLYVDDVRRSLYATSFPRLGLQSALDRFVEATVSAAGPGVAIVPVPCLNIGDRRTRNASGSVVALVGTGDAEQCSEAVLGLLKEDLKCMLPSCALVGLAMSPASGRYVAINAMFYVAYNMRMLGWDEEKVITPAEILAATRDFCRKGKAEIQAAPDAEWKYQRNSCFAGFLAYHLLREYGFSDDNGNITFLRQVDGRHCDWTRGALLFETVNMPSHFVQSLTEVRRPRSVKKQGATVWKVSCFLLLVVVILLALTILIMARVAWRPAPGGCSDSSSDQSSDKSEIEEGQPRE